MTYLYVALGGFLGSALRFYISILGKKHYLTTWIANITGSGFLAILFHYYYINPVLSDAVWLFAGVGFSGAFTTFSTFGNETILLLLNQKYLQAVLYVTSSFLIAITAVVVVLTIL